MNDINSNALLLQMRAMAARAQGAELAQPAAQTESNFSSLLRDAVNRVNDMQATSGEMKKAFEAGDPNVDIAEVMIASQKAGLAFQTTMQVRNRVVSAYQDIMNMPL